MRQDYIKHSVNYYYRFLRNPQVFKIQILIKYSNNILILTNQQIDYKTGDRFVFKCIPLFNVYMYFLIQCSNNN